MEKLIKFNTKEWVKELDLFTIIEETDLFSPNKNKPTFKVVSYDGCKKLANFFEVVVKETPIFLCQPTAENKHQHIWGCRVGFKGQSDRDDWAFCEGEASQFNTNPVNADTAGRPILDMSNIDAQFKSAMAYKRSRCKWVLRIIGLIWTYWAVESPSFKNNDGSISDYSDI